jgi:hypothetical protein
MDYLLGLNHIPTATSVCNIHRCGRFGNRKFQEVVLRRKLRGGQIPNEGLGGLKAFESTKSRDAFKPYLLNKLNYAPRGMSRIKFLK